MEVPEELVVLVEMVEILLTSAEAAEAAEAVKAVTVEPEELFQLMQEPPHLLQPLRLPEDLPELRAVEEPVVLVQRLERVLLVRLELPELPVQTEYS